ncbi:type II secretion system protein GspG [bacterium]|nr:type II secretion system protein GspG [bacterium]
MLPLRRSRRAGSAFTLIELLVVVAIIAILAAIAVPNFLEAQTRGKVAAAQSNIRTITGALEAFAVDNNRYPATQPVVPGDPLALLSDFQLSALTTPISYISPGAFHDPFGTVRARAAFPNKRDVNRGGDFPTLTQPNEQRSLLYYHYPSLSQRLNVEEINIFGASVISIGPDIQDSLGAYRPFSAAFFVNELQDEGIRHPVDTMYDPTNGTVSIGDIGGYTGEARRFRE